MNRRFLIGAVIVICLAGFLYDVVASARAGHRSVGEVLWQYWWAVLFLVSYGVATLVKRVRRR